ncbi:hypothetical protein TRFO_04278 [Tritrichomonas foetus]|uniref:PH domain-containing protein n=1 Tax=Tritrichomonas foetus TaxID=1144522 RepID=A0A1J4KKN9_9EUKA|nr:hypothetical protein TRFO_04278 [Tritrichomonas foetus]|eukprot:OHT10262.1 hypothetical protein TRFO_04278 [Tritrichomonas foetus]
MIDYLKFIYGDPVAKQASSLKQGETFSLQNTQKRSSNVVVTCANSEFSINSDNILCVAIDHVTIKLTDVMDEKTSSIIKSLIAIPPSFHITIVNLSVSTARILPKTEASIPFDTVIKTGLMHRASCPAGHSYPPEDEWGIVFGCPFYKTFPSSKSLPIVIVEGDITVTQNDHKPTNYYVYLVPLYLVFYDSQNSNKSLGNIFLTAAKIEVDKPQQFSIIKAGQKTSFTFSTIQAMQQWSQATLIAINNAATSLEKWRSENM